jgi:hypothetical protein
MTRSEFEKLESHLLKVSQMTKKVLTMLAHDFIAPESAKANIVVEVP